MSRNPIRKDKTCLNCKHVVENRFCPNCGQENSDTRKTFHHLFIHFFEDLTHYENAFWKTIKNLLLRPASLTKEYLSGKRLSYLAPVRLYIFISFVTFFLIAVAPDKEDDLLNINQTTTTTSKDNKIDTISAKKIGLKEFLKSDALTQSVKDSIQKNAEKVEKETKGDNEDGLFNTGYQSVAQIDSVQKFSKPSDKMGDFEYWINRKIQYVKDNNTRAEIIDKGFESALHNFPKVLILYMPLFAFFLWLFHSKKRWYYFDHGIFTLHYFSFLLLIYLIIFLFSKAIGLLGDSTLITSIKNIFKFVGYVWMSYYFYPAHHRFYGETRWVSFIKSVFLFFINMFFITIMLILFFLYTLINIH